MQPSALTKDKPERPKLDECCGSGNCYQCVWDEYRKELANWREKFHSDIEITNIK